MDGGEVMVRIAPSGRKTSRIEIAELEKALELSFPQEYIDFLENYNGGKPESNIIELDGSKVKPFSITSFSITSFYGFGLEPYEDINNNLNIFKGRIPDKCIPLAGVEGGNILVMSLETERYGYIYLWDHEEEYGYEFGGYKIESLSQVASSLSQLLSIMKPYDAKNVDMSGYKVESVWVNPEFLKKFQKGSDDK